MAAERWPGRRHEILGGVTRIDPADDTVDRWIAQWYRFDTDRRERRHTTVVAFDNAAEWEAEMSRLAEHLRRRKAAGCPRMSSGSPASITTPATRKLWLLDVKARGRLAGSRRIGPASAIG
jgi:hypothetical protein